MLQRSGKCRQKCWQPTADAVILHSLPSSRLPDFFSRNWKYRERRWVGKGQDVFRAHNTERSIDPRQDVVWQLDRAFYTSWWETRPLSCVCEADTSSHVWAASSTDRGPVTFKRPERLPSPVASVWRLSSAVNYQRFQHKWAEVCEGSQTTRSR